MNMLCSTIWLLYIYIYVCVCVCVCVNNCISIKHLYAWLSLGHIVFIWTRVPIESILLVSKMNMLCSTIWLFSRIATPLSKYISVYVSFPRLQNHTSFDFTVMYIAQGIHTVPRNPMLMMSWFKLASWQEKRLAVWIITWLCWLWWEMTSMFPWQRA